jgi:hypothetical protein
MSRPRIRPASGALTITEMNGARLQTTTTDPEVIRFKDELRQRWGDRVFLLVDTDNMEFAICGRDHGKEYLIFTTRQLSDQTIKRIYEADQGSAGYVDVVKKLEEAWAKEDADEDWILSEIAGDAGQRLAWAFRKDGLIDHENVYGPAPRRVPRAIRRGR